MAKKNDLRSDADMIVNEIENQLADILAEKKKEVTRSLEEKLQKEKEEAQKNLDQIEEEYKKEKEGLDTYKTLFVEFETKKSDFKDQMRSHLKKATSYQNEISSLTTQTLEELRAVNKMSQEMDDFKSIAQERLTSIKKDLQEKYGITAPVPKEETKDEVDLNLEQELSKLTKIKKLLEDQNVEEPQVPEDPGQNAEPDTEPSFQAEEEPMVWNEPEKREEAQEPSSDEKLGSQDSYEIEEPQENSELEIEPIPEPEIEHRIELNEEPQTELNDGPRIELNEEPRIDLVEDLNEPGEEKAILSTAEFIPAVEPETENNMEEAKGDLQGIKEEVPTTGENALNDLQSLNDMKTDANFEQVFETLEKFRKGSCTGDNGDVSYFKKNGSIIIDGECLISTLTNSLDGAKKLYDQLSKTESPKEQFFIKQDIIRYQEVLRKLMLVAIRMCEKESCSLPKYTLETLNVDILKSILEKVSMENWSDQDDFSSFDEYAKSLKDAYYAKITPSKSLKQLNLGYS